jgi:hypothetical protein
MGYYFLIGIIYAFINIYVRKFEEDNVDPLLTLVWITLWPICFIAIISGIAEDLIYKRKKS